MILDEDSTVVEKKENCDNEEMIRLLLKPLLKNLSDDLIKTLIDEFMKKRLVNKRDASYDFCYLYFQRHKGHLADNMECSCMHLWSYLASWGMLRNSPLLELSPAALKPLIFYFDSIYKSVVWSADVDTYSTHKLDILKVFAAIADILLTIMGKKPTITLVTKIMLGVFGCVPAIDKYFYKTFHVLYGGFGVFGQKELDNIEKFYQQHKAIIDKIVIPVIDFDGNPTEYNYKKAKLIDMIGYMVGQ